MGGGSTLSQSCHTRAEANEKKFRGTTTQPRIAGELNSNHTSIGLGTIQSEDKKRGTSDSE